MADEFEVNNVVVTATLSSKGFNLIEVTKKLPGAIYEPGNFPAVRLKRGPIGYLVYSSGKIVCTGSKSIESAKENVMKLKEEMDGYKIQTDEKPIVYVRNIVSSIDLKRDLKLHELSYLMEESEYNPEYFPGMKIRFGNTRILVFRTGKVILPGFSSLEDIRKTVKWLKKRLADTEKQLEEMK